MSEDVSAKLDALRGKVQAAAEQAVDAGLAPIFDASQGMVPVKTGRLKGTGKQSKAVSEGSVASGTISYGGPETKTNWHDVDYAILVHTPGTKFFGGIPYLEQPVMDAKGTILATMAAAFRKALS